MLISERAEIYQQRSKLRFNNAKWNYQAFCSISQGQKGLICNICSVSLHCLFIVLFVSGKFVFKISLLILNTNFPETEEHKKQKAQIL